VPTVSFCKSLESAKVVVKGDELEWYVTTGGGQTAVSTNGRRNVVAVKDKVVLIDPLGNISEIELSSIDKKSLKVLNKTI